MSVVDQKNKRISFESVALFKELISKNQLKNLRSVKSNPYPIYCFKATKPVMDIIASYMVSNNMKCDRTTDGSWEDFEKTVVKAEKKPEIVVTRNLRVVKRAVAEGYGTMLKRTCVDQHGKKAFVFYSTDRILEIKTEEDEKNRERFEKRAKEKFDDECLLNNKKKVDTEMSKLIKKAMEGKR